MKKTSRFLPQLIDSIPEAAYGYTVSMYSVALEGWRRGLTLKFFNNTRRRSELKYSLTYKEKQHFFSVARGDVVPKEAIKVCINKNLTKDYLVKAGVPVPEGKTFTDSANDEEIINFANELGYPIVLKPSDGTGGSGVIANIKDTEEFKSALSYVKYDLKYSSLIVERYISGEDFRLYVIDGKVIAAFKKTPANVVGDGRHSIGELIDLKNKERTKTPALHNRPIKLDKESHKLLQKQGLTLESIPKKNKVVYLKTKNNVSSGGDPIDVTDELTEEVKNIAINASKAIPGLVQCGVDMMVDLNKGTGVVLEVNSRPHITAHLFPMEGNARDIPKAVIDYYFPDTKQPDYSQTPLYYFDFKTIFDSFTRGVCKEFTVPDVPQGDLFSTRFWIDGVHGSEKYAKWIRKIAISCKLHGYVKHLKNGKTSVVVSGPTTGIGEFRNIIQTDAPKGLTVKQVSEKDWLKPVQVGFEIISYTVNKKEKGKLKKEAEEKISQVDASIEGYHPVKLPYPTKKKGKKKKLSKSVVVSGKDDLELLRKERDYYKKKYSQVINSTSWKLTKPVRAISGRLKNTK